MRIKGVLAAVLAGALVSASAAHAQSPVEATPYGGSFSTPVSATGAPGYPDLLYVVELEGVVEVVDSGEQLSEPFLDISDEITAATVITHEGRVVHEATQKLLAPAGGVQA